MKIIILDESYLMTSATDESVGIYDFNISRSDSLESDIIIYHNTKNGFFKVLKNRYNNESIVNVIKKDILKKPKTPKRVFLIDIDGTICEDIKNEDSHLYPTALPIPNSLKILNKWYNEGHTITFFTAREEKDRQVTEDWLNRHGFKYHGLVMNKPRIKDGEEYVWIDNRKVRAITYLGTWGELKEVDAKIQTFG